MPRMVAQDVEPIQWTRAIDRRKPGLKGRPMDMVLAPGIVGMDVLTRRHVLRAGLVGLALCPLVRTRPLIAAPAGTPVPGQGNVAGLLNIGAGRRLWLECRGVGNPTVVLEAGAGNDAAIWDTVALPMGSTKTAVLPGVAAFTRVCAYDRPGTVLDPADPAHRSRSDPAPMPRTASEMVADLHALLRAAGVPGPYVMAGHSFGGLVVRLYASTYPDEVAGLVLVDAAQEDYYAGVQALLTPAQWAAYAKPTADLSPGVERIDTEASAAQMRKAAATSPLRPMLLVVLTHGRPWDWPPGYPVAALEGLWTRLQDRLAALVPNARLVVARDSGHYIQLDQPDLVIDAIRQVVEAVRHPGTWSTPAATPEA